MLQLIHGTNLLNGIVQITLMLMLTSTIWLLEITIPLKKYSEMTVEYILVKPMVHLRKFHQEITIM